MNVSISGGSTNQRHIYSKLHFNLTLKLRVLFGRRVAQDLSSYNYNLLKHDKNVSFTPKIEQMNPESNKIVKLFHKAIFKNRNSLSNIYTITKNFCKNTNIEILNHLTPIEIFKVWIIISSKNPEYKDVMIESLEWVVQEKTIEEILTNIQEKVDSFKIDNNIIDEHELIYDSHIFNHHEFNLDKLFFYDEEKPVNTTPFYNKIRVK